MNKLEAWRKGTTDYRINFLSLTNWRAYKKMERKLSSGAPYYAYLLGQSQAYRDTPKRNPFAPGRRHDEFELGYNQADPMGDWHGNNA